MTYKESYRAYRSGSWIDAARDVRNTAQYSHWCHSHCFDGAHGFRLVSEQ